MKEFIDKLISRLYEESFSHDELDGDAYYLETEEAISIVNQLAEEYKHCTLCYLQSPCEYQNENAMLPVSELADDNGWIACSERLPERNESVLCYAKSTARGGDTWFVGSCDNGFWFLQTAIGTLSYPTQYEVVAWQALPAPYQPKGE